MFYNDFELKMMEFNFKLNPLNCALLADRTCCFETDITGELRSWLKSFDVKMSEDESKLHFALKQDGTIGHVLDKLNKLKIITKFNFQRSYIIL